MKTKEVTINGKTFVVRTLMYAESKQLRGLDVETVEKKIYELAAGVTEEQYNQLTLQEGITLGNAINELNGLAESTNFQKS